MDNVTKLVEQIHSIRPGLRIDTIWHEQTCKPPCTCDCRALVITYERDNSRAGVRRVRRIVRLRPDAPEKPFQMPKVDNSPSEPDPLKKEPPNITWE